MLCKRIKYAWSAAKQHRFTCRDFYNGMATDKREIRNGLRFSWNSHGKILIYLMQGLAMNNRLIAMACAWNSYQQRIIQRNKTVHHNRIIFATRTSQKRQPIQCAINSRLMVLWAKPDKTEIPAQLYPVFYDVFQRSGSCVIECYPCIKWFCVVERAPRCGGSRRFGDREVNTEWKLYRNSEEIWIHLSATEVRLIVRNWMQEIKLRCWFCMIEVVLWRLLHALIHAVAEKTNIGAHSALTFSRDASLEQMVILRRTTKDRSSFEWKYLTENFFRLIAKKVVQQQLQRSIRMWPLALKAFTI